jgi:hypothetical protein
MCLDRHFCVISLAFSASKARHVMLGSGCYVGTRCYVISMEYYSSQMKLNQRCRHETHATGLFRFLLLLTSVFFIGSRCKGVGGGKQRTIWQCTLGAADAFLMADSYQNSTEKLNWDEVIGPPRMSPCHSRSKRQDGVYHTTIRPCLCMSQRSML